jgi:ATP-dependent DNA helicase DinG
VDVPGDALQMVVIDKLPFPPPSDPLVQARTKLMEAAGRSVFMDYFIPEAAVALKQGAGRLIRREYDRGVLVVCDTRLARMGWSAPAQGRTHAKGSNRVGAGCTTYLPPWSEFV